MAPGDRSGARAGQRNHEQFGHHRGGCSSFTGWTWMLGDSTRDKEETGACCRGGSTGDAGKGRIMVPSNHRMVCCCGTVYRCSRMEYRRQRMRVSTGTRRKWLVTVVSGPMVADRLVPDGCPFRDYWHGDRRPGGHDLWSVPNRTYTPELPSRPDFRPVSSSAVPMIGDIESNGMKEQDRERGT